jgi:hypothetical protein
LVVLLVTMAGVAAAAAVTVGGVSADHRAARRLPASRRVDRRRERDIT